MDANEKVTISKYGSYINTVEPIYSKLLDTKLLGFSKLLCFQKIHFYQKSPSR